MPTGDEGQSEMLRADCLWFVTDCAYRRSSSPFASFYCVADNFYVNSSPVPIFKIVW
ncbi:MAG: hypothetical protein JXM69_16645 [Anaerolineae bacterium]|nr:hypothetical protein [Anaerolineae bacterium]